MGESMLGRNSPTVEVPPYPVMGSESLREAQLWPEPRREPAGAAGGCPGSACSGQQAVPQREQRGAERAGSSWALDVVMRSPPSVFRGSDGFEEGSRMLNLSRFENIQGSDMKGRRGIQIELGSLKEKTV